MNVRVLIADDHQLVIDGLSSFVNNTDGFELVATAANGAEAIENIDLFNPHVVLLDINMPILDGIQALEKIKKNSVPPKIIMLTMHDETSIIKKVMQLGADGYLLKTSDKDEVITAIQKVSLGQKYFSSEVALALAEGKKGKSSSNDKAKMAELTEREIEILKLIAEGFSNKEIGEKLFISHRTVDTHRTNLAKKLEVKNIAGLIKFAIKNGLVE